MFWFFAYIGFCSLVGWFGSKRRFGFWGYFLFSFIFTPLIGLLLVSASDKPKPLKPGSQWNKIVWELDQVRSYLTKFECAGLKPAETRELADRLAALQRSVMSNLD